MPNVSTKILDGVVTHTVNLLKLSASEQARTLGMLKKLELSLVADLENVAGKTPLAVSRLGALLQQTRDTIGQHYDAIGKANAQTLGKVAQLEAVKTVNVANGSIGVPLLTVAHSPEQLAALAGKTLVNGKYPAEWWASQSEQLRDKFATQMREGALRGEGVEALTRRIRGTAAKGYTDGIMVASKAQATALVRTSIISTANEARLKTLAANADVVKGIQWVATLDSRTTPICRALDGKQWTNPGLVPVGHDKAFPGSTAHWQCRSTQIPVTRSWAELAGPKAKFKPPGSKAVPADLGKTLEQKLVDGGMTPENAKAALTETRASMDGQVAEPVDFDQWLKTKPVEFQDQLLGPQRAALWREGKVTMAEMTDQQNHPLSIAELHAMVAANADVKPAKDGEGGLGLAERKALETAMAHGIKKGAVLTTYMDGAGKHSTIEGTSPTAADLATLDWSKGVTVLRNSTAAGEVWTAQELQLFASLPGFRKAIMVGPTGKTITLEMYPGKSLTSAEATAINKAALALQNSGLNTQNTLAKAIVDAGPNVRPLKSTPTGTVKPPPKVFNEVFPPAEKPAPFFDPKAAKVEADKAAALKLKADQDALAKAQAAQQAAAQKAADDAYAAAAAEALATAKAKEAAAALKAKQAAEVAEAAVQAEAQAKLGEILANPQGQTLKAQAIGKLMKAHPSMKPAELLAQAHIDAQAAQAKATQTGALNGYKKKVLAGQDPTPAQIAAVEKFIAEDKTKADAWLDALNAQVEAQKAQQHAEAAKAADQQAQAAVAPVTPPKPPKAAPVTRPVDTTEPSTPRPVAPVNEAAFPLSVGQLKEVRSLGGTTGARLVRDAQGREYVLKTGASPAHVVSEMSADRIYAVMSVPVPEGRLYPDAPGGPVKLTRYLGQKSVTLEQFITMAHPTAVADVKAQLRQHFVLDALLGNHDVIGADRDNILVVGTVPYRVDNGGALLFRAQGGAKELSLEVRELDSMRDPAINPRAAEVFRGITDVEIREQVRAILRNRNAIIEALPSDPALRATINARIDNLRLQWAGKTEPEPAPSTVPTDLGKRVRAARVNGLAILGDGPHVEDMHTLVWQERDAAGNPVTRMKLKLTLDGSQTLVQTVGEDRFVASRPARSSTAPASTAHPVDAQHGWFAAIQNAAKTTNTHAQDGQYNPTKVAAMVKVKDQIEDAQDTGALDAQGQKMAAAYLEMISKIEAAQAGKKPMPPPYFEQFVVKPAKTKAAPKPQTTAGPVAVEQADMRYPAKTLTAGHATETTGIAGQGDGSYKSQWSDAYTLRVGEATIRFYRPTGNLQDQRGLALQGQVEVTIPGEASAATIQAAQDAMRALGIDLTPPSPAQQEMVYLRRGVYILAGSRNPPDFDAILNSGASEPERIAKAKQWIKTKYGVDLPDATTPAYDPAGTSNTWGEGHRHWWRWDRTRQSVDKDMLGYTLIHHSDVPLANLLDQILNSGGELTPTVERLRKGIPITSGKSPDADLSTGGAAYFMFRIRKSADARSCLAIRISNLARQDVVSQYGDTFGRPAQIAQRQIDPAGWKRNSGNWDNEAIFKHGVNLLDELDTVWVRDEAERQKVIGVFAKHGWTKLPDGRPVPDVVRVRA